MTRTADTVDIHRALDQAFARVPASAESQDLKEEVRASLMARVAALEASGVPAGQAARTALDEIGDLRDVVATIADVRAAAGGADLHAAHRVRPRPAFVLRATVLGVLLAGLITLLVLVAVGVLDWSAGVTVALAAGLALASGVLVADGLRQETTASYPLPTGRAVGFGAASAVAAGAIGLVPVVVVDPDLTRAIIVAGVLGLAAGLAFVALGVTQTNRRKPWTLELGRQTAAANRFDEDPAAAARFGIYSAALGLVAVVAFVVLSITVGFAWSWLALAAVVPVYFLMLARMLFPAGHRPA